MRLGWKVLIGVGVVFAGMQAIRPAKTNPLVKPEHELHNVLPVDSKTADTFSRSCADCHSNRTNWPWYSKVAPVSWLVVYDVNEGRRELNLSEWGAYTPQRRARKLQQICGEVREREMPGTLYPVLHPTAKLTGADVEALCAWTASVGSTNAGR